MRVVTVTCVVGLMVGLVAGAAWSQFPAQPQQPPPQQPQQPQQPQVPAQPQPPADPRVDRIKAGLQQRNFRIYEVTFTPPKDSSRAPLWWVEVAATYAQPSNNTVAQQALDMWGIVYGVVSQEPPQTIMGTSQIWNKYAIVLSTEIGLYTDLLNRYRAAPDNEKKQVVEGFLGKVRFFVWDLERNQRADTQDFVNKHFTR